ncbi:methyltransferase domain-containing protein [Candidatus Woesearchaeota archaeon]|nr:methyltransferase domain-containing protein [Candidatus Woesearchaeota archaeon]
MKLILNNENQYLVKDPSKDFHCSDGLIKAEELSKAKAETNKGVVYSIIDPTFSDIYAKMKRQAQIITLKDIGTIISETGIGKDSKVLDAGSGSGALCCFLANICKKVISYELREDHQKVAMHNKDLLGIKNLTLKSGDIREKIAEKDFDVIILDMPDPWNALKTTKAALKRGGYIVVYSPTIPQVMDVQMHAKDHDLLFVKTLENIQRPWEINDRKVRPVSSYINHTAFLTFLRKI